MKFYLGLALLMGISSAHAADDFEKVQPGDTLRKISLRLFNTRRHWHDILDANSSVIKDPDHLVVGTRLVIPNFPKKTETASDTNTATVFPATEAEGESQELTSKTPRHFVSGTDTKLAPTSEAPSNRNPASKTLHPFTEMVLPR